MSIRAGRQFNQTSDDIGSALEKCCRVNKATWTGLQRGSSMSRFLLVDSLVAVGSSVLLYVIELTEKNGRKIRSSFLSLVISSIRRDAAPPFLFVSTLSPPARPLSVFVTSTPFPPLFSFCTSLCFSLSFPLSPLALLNFSSSRLLYLST